MTEHRCTGHLHPFLRVTRVTGGWQECARTTRKGRVGTGLRPPYGYSLSRTKSSCIISFEDAWRQDAVKFSREFGGLLRPKYCLAGHLALNSRENLIPEGAYFHRNSGSSSELGQGKQLLYCPFSDCVRTLLSPSCHPCHPWKRVQTPCTSVFCHPDTLKYKIHSIVKKGAEGWHRVMTISIERFR